MIDWSSCETVERDAQRASGAWVFRGTRVPVAALFENLEEGASVSEFVDWFPGVTIEQARAVLEHVARSSVVPDCASGKDIPNFAAIRRRMPVFDPPLSTTLDEDREDRL